METTDEPMELWGGAECTINRVGDQFFSQLARNGHRHRLEDLDRFAELGIRALRFPILWEEMAPDSLEEIDWRTIDAQLNRLRDLGIRPIAGLVHHGSGPRYTSLLDPEFPTKLAAFARLVAQRYPWIDAFTPVNEPLTTARFSGLYGHWYPHGRDGFTFGRILVNQCRGVAMAMRAIREVNPSAMLVQTEDLGKTYSRPALRYQSDFENDRRWITWDLLGGRVTRDHPMWSYFDWIGLDPESIAIFEREPCPPDVVGVNYYITSERFLDDQVHGHPENSGGNGRHRYADVEAVRIRAEGIAGPEAILREAAGRYHLPLAITEAHLGCTREEQLRWLKEIWGAGQKLRGEGLDVHAVTAWSLLGAFDWNSLLTRQDNHYEPGAFDMRGGKPRPTAVAGMLRQLSAGENFAHPVLETPAWWRRSLRLGHAARHQDQLERAFQARRATVRPILITGGGGRLAKSFALAAEMRGLAYRSLTRAELDIADESALEHSLHVIAPWAIINCAGFADVDAAEQEQDLCLRSNLQGAEHLALACARSKTPLLTLSSDFVFDGLKREPYVESDQPAPLNFYGESKATAEDRIRRAFPNALIIRPGKVFAPHGETDPLRVQLEALARGERVRVASDLRFSPTYLPDLVQAALDLLIDSEIGIWHLTNSEAVTAEEFLFSAANFAHLNTNLIEGVPAWSLNRKALRPLNRALRSERGQLLPSLADALQRYVRELPQPLRSVRAFALP